MRKVVRLIKWKEWHHPVDQLYVYGYPYIASAEGIGLKHKPEVKHDLFLVDVCLCYASKSVTKAVFTMADGFQRDARIHQQQQQWLQHT
jgi:hypothetical protein